MGALLNSPRTFSLSLESAKVIPYPSPLVSLERSALANLLLRPVLVFFLKL